MLKHDFKINLPEQCNTIISFTDHLKTHVKKTYLITTGDLVNPSLSTLMLLQTAYVNPRNLCLGCVPVYFSFLTI